MQEEFSKKLKFFCGEFLAIFCAEGVAELKEFIYNENGRVMDAKTKDVRPFCRKKERRHA